MRKITFVTLLFLPADMKKKMRYRRLQAIPSHRSYKFHPSKCACKLINTKTLIKILMQKCSEEPTIKKANQISRNPRRFSAPEFLRTSITTTRFFCLCKLYATDFPCVFRVVFPNS
jgi:hypothetical protein